MKKNLLITATLVLSLFTSCAHKMGDAIAITVYTDSIVSVRYLFGRRDEARIPPE